MGNGEIKQTDQRAKEIEGETNMANIHTYDICNKII